MPVTRHRLLVDKRGECCEGFSHFVNRRNRASRSYSDLTDWKLAGPNSPIVCPHRRTEANKQTNNSLAEKYTHGGCRFAVLKKNSGSRTPSWGRHRSQSRSVTPSAMVAVSLAAIVGNRVGCLSHARGSPSMMKSLPSRAQVHLHHHQADA